MTLTIYNNGAFGGVWRNVNIEDDIPINNWTNIVGVFDEQSEVAQLYINGELKTVENRTDHGGPVALNSSSDDVVIGNKHKNQGFHGGIDDVRIYNSALSESEIQQLYNEGNESCDGRYDEGYESGKQYCIDNPEKCGISVGDGEYTQADLDVKYDEGYNKGLNDGKKTCEEPPVCNEVITYGKLPNIDCWVEFPTPCDVPEGWETTYEELENMCGIVPDNCNVQLPLNDDNCASFNMFTNILHIPCLDLGTPYWLDLELEGDHLKIKDYGEN